MTDVEKLLFWRELLLCDAREAGGQESAERARMRAGLLTRAADALAREPALMRVVESLRETVGILEMLGHDGKDAECEWCVRASRAHAALRALDEVGR